MKLNNLSRLTALLMAMVLSFTSVAWADSSVDFSALTGTYFECVDWATGMSQQGYCVTCLDALARYYVKSWPAPGYYCLYDHLDSMTALTRYSFLTDIYAKYQAAQAEAKASENPDYSEMDYYYGLYMGYWNGANGHTDTDSTTYPQLLCCTGCTVYNQNALVAPGSNHLKGTCPWYNEYASLAEQFSQLTTDDERKTFVGALTEDELYGLLDELGWIANTSLVSGNVSVNGRLPEGTTLVAKNLSEDMLTSELRDFILEEGGADDTVWTDCCYGLGILGYDVSLNFYGREIEPKSELTVTVANVHDNSEGAEHVDTYIMHVLDSVASIRMEMYAGKSVYYSNDEALIANYGADSKERLAAKAMGQDGYVAYTLESDKAGDNVVVYADGSVTFTVNSFTDITITITEDQASTSNYQNRNDTENMFYWRLEDELTAHTYGDGADAEDDTDVDCLGDVIQSVTYESTATDANGNISQGTVPHYLYSSVGTGLTVQDVLNDSTTEGFVLHIKTQPGYIVTSFRISCEVPGSREGEKCATVSTHSLVYEPNEDHLYKSDINITYTSSSVFGHGSNTKDSSLNYVLILTVSQVTGDIDATKTADPTIVTPTNNDNGTVTYTVQSENISEQLHFTNAAIQDAYLNKGVTVTSVTLTKNDGSNKVYSWANGDLVVSYTTTTRSNGKVTTNTNKLTYNSAGVQLTAGNVDDGILYIEFSTALKSAIDPYDYTTHFWIPGDVITIVYEYDVTDSDVEAGSFTNTAVVTGYSEDGSEFKKVGFSSVTVVINKEGFGHLHITKDFMGLTVAEVNELDFYMTATGNVGGYSYSTEDGDGTLVTELLGAGTTEDVSDDGVRLTWTVLNAVDFEEVADETVTFTVSEYGYNATVNGKTYQSTTVNGVANTNGSTTVEVEAQSTGLVSFVNTYAEQPQESTLTVVKEGLTGDESAIVKVKFGDMEYMLVLNAQNNWAQTISGLTIGSSYTVTEMTDWTWRYPSVTYNDPNAGVIVAEGGTVTITNSGRTDQWLSDESSVVNFTQTGTN